MHRLISDVHPSIGAAFEYMSYEDVDLERLEAERRSEAKRATALRRSSRRRVPVPFRPSWTGKPRSSSRWAC